jgi:hypothetical protein
MSVWDFGVLHCPTTMTVATDEWRVKRAESLSAQRMQPCCQPKLTLIGRVNLIRKSIMIDRPIRQGAPVVEEEGTEENDNSGIIATVFLNYLHYLVPSESWQHTHQN